MKFKFLFLFLISIILFTSIVNAQDCDYYEYENHTENVNYYIIDGKDFDKPFIEIKNYAQSSRRGDRYITYSTSPTKFDVFNNYENTITINLSYIVEGNRINKLLTIKPLYYETISHNYPNNINEESIQFEITEPSNIEQGTRVEIIVDKICKNCASDEIFCQVNSECVKKNVVPLNVKPQCGLYQECVSQYMNPDTGNCEKSPAQIQEEENQRLKEEIARKEKERKFLIFSIIGLVSVIIIGGIIIYVLKYKNEKEKQNTLQKEIELEAKKIQSKEFELNELKKQIAQIKKHKKLEKKEIEKLNNLKSKRDKLIHDIEKQYEDITKPFPDSQAKNRMVVINPYLGGYKCFYKEGMDLKNYPISSLLHRWVWKKNNGRDPKLGYHIHHIDEDKYNNDPRNLEEIPGDEHYEKHRYK